MWLLQRGQQDASAFLPVHGGGPFRNQHVLLRVPAVRSAKGQGLMPAGHTPPDFFGLYFPPMSSRADTCCKRLCRGTIERFCCGFIGDIVDRERAQVEMCWFRQGESSLDCVQRSDVAECVVRKCVILNVQNHFPEVVNRLECFEWKITCGSECRVSFLCLYIYIRVLFSLSPVFYLMYLLFISSFSLSDTP